MTDSTASSSPVGIRDIFTSSSGVFWTPMEAVSKMTILSNLNQFKEIKNILHSLEYRGKYGAA